MTTTKTPDIHETIREIEKIKGQLETADGADKLALNGRLQELASLMHEGLEKILKASRNEGPKETPKPQAKDSDQPKLELVRTRLFYGNTVVTTYKAEGGYVGIEATKLGEENGTGIACSYKLPAYVTIRNRIFVTFPEGPGFSFPDLEPCTAYELRPGKDCDLAEMFVIANNDIVRVKGLVRHGSRSSYFNAYTDKIKDPEDSTSNFSWHTCTIGVSAFATLEEARAVLEKQLARALARINRGMAQAKEEKIELLAALGRVVEDPEKTIRELVLKEYANDVEEEEPEDDDDDFDHLEIY